ncbi:MAG TPA: hypothetical protein DEB46_06725 [Myxococcales bacterium]|nr:hypothetical protein [Myxococcales bacterium]
MKLERLHLCRSVGLPDGLDAIEPAPGLNLILGANGSGKSSLTAGVLQSLFDEVEDEQLVMTMNLSEGVSLSHAHGKSTWKGGIPQIPPTHLASSYRLGLLDLGQEGDSEADLVQRLKRELAGGYDLGVLSEGRRLKQGYGRTAWQTHHGAEQALQKALNRYDSLQRKQRGLALLKEELRLAEQSQARQQDLEQAKRYLERRKTIAQDEAIVAAAPQNWREIPLDAVEQVQRMESQLAEWEERWRELKREFRRHEEEVAALALDEPLAESDLTAWRHRAKRLEGWEREQVDRQRQRASLTPTLQVEDQGQLLPNIDALEAKILERSTLLQQRDALEVIDPGDGPPSDQRPESIQLGRGLLVQWLHSARPRQLPPWILFVLALLVLMGSVLGIQGEWLGYGVAALALFMLVWTRHEPESGRTRLQRDYENTGLPRPQSWDEDAVGETMVQLNEQLQIEDTVRLQAQLRRQNESARTRLQGKLDELDDELKGIARSLGLSEDISGLGLREAVEALKDRRMLAKLEGEVEVAEKAINALRNDALEALACFGLKTPIDGPGLDAFVENLADRSRKLTHLRTQKGLLEERSTQLTSDRDQLLERRDRVLDGGDLDALKARVVEAVAARDAEVRLDRDRRELEEIAAQIDDPELLDCDDEDLQVFARSCEQAFANVAVLSEQIGSIEADIQRTQDDAPLRQADQSLESASEELARLYEEGLECLADKFLAARLQADYQSQSSPQLFGRVRQRLETFTQGRYELELRGKALRAVDHGGLGSQSLGALSHGTRVQLLLAARLAFIEAHEGESRLPLFLDEALSITDPERFEAVVTVLMDLVDQGRQIFYLSCDDADVHRWARATQSLGRPAPNVIRLGHLAELSEYVEPPEVQEPQPGESAADYGVRIGVARFGLWSSFESLDLFYLIEDRLDLVHRLRQVQQRRVGPYVALRSRARNPAHLTHEELALIDHRIALFRDFLRLQRVGRGAPIRREVFNDDRLKPSSRALVEDLVQAVDGDVVALMDCVKARQGDAFRRKQRDLADVVEQILEESGALDPRPILGDPARLGRLADLHGDRLDGEQIASLDRRWSQRILGLELTVSTATTTD